MNVAFYCVSGSDFFPGAVALVNSLRLLGHDDPIYVLDCGLTAEQRELLGRETAIVPAPGANPPSMLKLAAPLAQPAQTMVLLDADLIVTRSLADPIALAAEGKLVAFENESHRHFPEWAQLGGAAEVREGPYLSSSAVFVGGGAGRLLPIAAAKLAELDRRRTWLERGSEEDPFFYADQDVLNALAVSELEADEVIALDGRLAPVPPFAGLALGDDGDLSVAHRDGTEPLMLHHFFRKPWLVRMKSNIYSRLLTRLLLAPDVAVRLERRRLPLRLRTGALATASRLAVDVGIGAPASAYRRIAGRPESIRAWPQSGAAPGR